MSIRTYFITLLTVCAVTAIASALAPEGANKKYVSFVLAVIVMLVLLSPLATLVGTDVTWEMPSTGGDVTEEEPLLRVCEREVKSCLCQELSLSQEEVSVTIYGHVDDEGQVTIRMIEVMLSGKSQTARERVYARLTSAGEDYEVRVQVTGK